MTSSWLLVGVLLLASVPWTPVGLATSPSPPFEGHVEIQGEPRTGAAVDVTFRLHANSPLDETFHPWAPAWVTGSRAPWVVQAEAGDDVERTWKFTPTREGFWLVGLASGPDASSAGMGCCSVVVFSTRLEGRTESDEDGLLPVPDVSFASHVETEGDGAVAVYEIHPRSDWMRFGNVTVQWSSHGDPGGQVNVPVGQASVVRRPIALPESGNGVVTFLAHWTADMEAPEVLMRPAGMSLDCRNISAMREGATIRDDGAWSCYAESVPSRPRWLASPGPALAALLVGLAAWRRPRAS